LFTWQGFRDHDLRLPLTPPRSGPARMMISPVQSRRLLILAP
jgi:hypothetical protein